MKVISLVQQKGGAGRSTIATNIAGILSKAHNVTLIDCDVPQGTSASWFAIRQEDYQRLQDVKSVKSERLVSGNLRALTADSNTSLVNQVQDVSTDYLILDAPPRDEEITRAILMLSDLLLIPLEASAAEIWATTDLLDTIEDAEKKRKGLIIRIVWNRYRGYTKSAQELSKAVNTEIPVKSCKTTLGYRVAYSEALGRGLTAAEWGSTAARHEIVALTAEIVKLLK
jgi:chromosome partitioning protein